MKWISFQISIVVITCWVVWPEISNGRIEFIAFAVFVAWLLTDGISEAVDGMRSLLRRLRNRARAPGKKSGGEITLNPSDRSDALGVGQDAEGMSRIGEKGLGKRL